MAGLCAAARARELGIDVARPGEGRPRRRVDAALELRHLALPRVGGLPGGVPRRRRSAPAARLGAARRRARLARVARSAGRRARDRQPANERAAVRPSRADRDARARRRAAYGSRRRSRRIPSSARAGDRRLPGLAGARAALRDSGRRAAPTGRTRGAPATGSRSRVARGAGLTPGMDEFYGRAMPAPPAAMPEAGLRPARPALRQLRARRRRAGRGARARRASWSEVDLVQAIARLPGARAWYLVDEPTLDVRVRERTVRELVEAAREAGGTVLLPAELPFEVPDSYRYAVHVAPGSRTRSAASASTSARACCGRTGRRSTASTRPAPTSAGSRPAGMRAASLPALVLGLAAAEDVAGRETRLSGRDRVRARPRVAGQRRRSDLRHPQAAAPLRTARTRRRAASPSRASSS